MVLRDLSFHQFNFTHNYSRPLKHKTAASMPKIDTAKLFNAQSFSIYLKSYFQTSIFCLRSCKHHKLTEKLPSERNANLFLTFEAILFSPCAYLFLSVIQYLHVSGNKMRRNRLNRFLTRHQGVYRDCSHRSPLLRHWVIYLFLQMAFPFKCHLTPLLPPSQALLCF